MTREELLQELNDALRKMEDDDETKRNVRNLCFSRV